MFRVYSCKWCNKLGIKDRNCCSIVYYRRPEAEYMATTDAYKEAIWIKRLMEELGYTQQKILVYCDSQSALHIARSPSSHSRTKHIDVQYHFVREVVEEGSVDMQKIHTCLLYTSPSPRDGLLSRMPSSA